MDKTKQICSSSGTDLQASFLSDFVGAGLDNGTDYSSQLSTKKATVNTYLEENLKKCRIMRVL